LREVTLPGALYLMHRFSIRFFSEPPVAIIQYRRDQKLALDQIPAARRGAITTIT
jgi:hypothetical protein